MQNKGGTKRTKLERAKAKEDTQTTENPKEREPKTEGNKQHKQNDKAFIYYKE